MRTQPRLSESEREERRERDRERLKQAAEQLLTSDGWLATCAIAQHFSRSGTSTDQAWIESLFSHVKADWPHLDRIRDPAVLRAELASVRYPRSRPGRSWR